MSGSFAHRVMDGGPPSLAGTSTTLRVGGMRIQVSILTLWLEVQRDKFVHIVQNKSHMSVANSSWTRKFSSPFSWCSSLQNSCTTTKSPRAQGAAMPNDTAVPNDWQDQNRMSNIVWWCISCVLDYVSADIRSFSLINSRDRCFSRSANQRPGKSHVSSMAVQWGARYPGDGARWSFSRRRRRRLPRQHVD